ncbi:MAG: sodium-extruding oxaloacetate decarboxylase subunit alpha [Thermodesulfovibrionales bacterium]|nr:sodium-extruding oxaloacetate decarboxylase subunit alpha [Thermodesulfovibrionales bacterium]
MKKLKISELVLRDAHQSLFATRMLTSDMLPIADKLDSVGYWSIESWGGATFDTCIRFLNEDPWERIRVLKRSMPITPQQMLLRGQSILGYRNYADDVVEKCVERMAINGVDVFRIFDALNDPRNLIVPIKAVKKMGKHAQAAISYTISPVHTIEGYVELAKEFANMGADSICIKDMAALLKPYDAFNLVRALKKAIDLPIHVHSHATTGMSVATLVKSVEAGADIVDTVISSMSMGTSHSPTEAIVEIFRDTEFDTGLDINLLLEIADYFRAIRPKYKKFESSFVGADARILAAQIPGGMLSNLENQLKEQNALHKMPEVLKENARVQKDFGYPPLVTPTSQIVGTQAVLNVLLGRYSKLTAESMNLLVGKYGRTPAKPDPELVKMALKGLNMDKPIDCRPADLIPNELESIEKELKQKLGQESVPIDDVLTYAMFPQIALKFFQNRHKGPVSFEEPASAKASPTSERSASNGHAVYIVNVDNKEYRVTVREEGSVQVSPSKQTMNTAVDKNITTKKAEVVEAPIAGIVLKLTKNNGDPVNAEDTVLVIESMKMELDIKAQSSGKITYLVDAGASVEAGQVLANIS